MKTKLLVAAAIAAVTFSASAASALTITTIGPATNGAQVDFVPAGFKLITDFNSTGGTGADSKGGAIDDLASGYTFTQGPNDYTRLGSGGSEAGVTAVPPFDTGYYETVSGGTKNVATLTDLDGYLTSFSFYMGSPDNANHLALTIVGADGTTTLTGKQIWCQNPAAKLCQPGNGDASKGFTVVYNFDGADVKTISFSSNSNSFEFDTLAGVSVPEPASWALMIMGFGFAGATMRAKRRTAALA